MAKPSGIEQEAERRRRALEAFMARRGLKPKPWAKLAGVSENTIYNFLKRRARSLSHPTLEKLARAASTTVAEIMNEDSILHTLPESLGAVPFPSDGPMDLPVYGSSQGASENLIITIDQEPVTYIRRPPHLIGVKDAFAVTAVGGSMHPMYKNGQTIYGRSEVPLKPGAGILIEKESDEAIIKEFVGHASTGLVVKEYRPDEREFTVPFGEIRRAVRLFGAIDD